MSFTIQNVDNTIVFDNDLKERFITYQNYIPLYKNYFKIDDWSKFSLNYPILISSLKSTDHYNRFFGITSNGESIPIFAKFCPLFDSTRYMIGKVGKEKISIPKHDNEEHHFSDPNNSAYVDSFFSYLTSKMFHNHDFVHGLNCYGSCLGVQRDYRIDIQDDIEYLFDSDYFMEHRDDFNITDEIYEQFEPIQSSKYKKRLMINDDEEIKLELDEINCDFIPDTTANSFKSTDLVYIKEHSNNNPSKHTDESSSCSSRSSATTDEDCEDSISESEYIDEEEVYTSLSSSMCSSNDEDKPIYASIKEFPVNMVLLEACKETLDEYMLENDITENEWSAILLQIIMSLIVFQEKFLFIHNDLHNSNIMYVPTNKEYLYYKYHDTYYKVPTYGKIWKIIDFGRAIYKFKGNVIFSDSFSEKGDASTQYNCEPYLNPIKKIVPPNFSFDLCRLACSMYDYFEEIEELPTIKSLICEWVKDDKGRNILYKNNGDERYPEFKLYKMITRSVHCHIPKDQLSNKLFSQYSISRKNIKKNQKVMRIDDIPIYVD